MNLFTDSSKASRAYVIVKAIARHLESACAGIAQEMDRLSSSETADERSARHLPPQIDPRDVTLSIQSLPDLMTVKEAAHFMRIGPTSIYAMMDRGELNYVKVQSRRRIPKTALAQIIDPNLKGGWKLRQHR